MHFKTFNLCFEKRCYQITVFSQTFLFPGLSRGSSDIMGFQQTDTLSSSTASGVKLEHGDTVYTTVMCTNAVALSQELTSRGNLIVSIPPLSSGASVHFYPQSTNEFPARSNSQSVQDEVHFAFHGFQDITGIKVRYSA